MSPDTVHVRSRALVELLITRGCRPIAEHPDGSRSFNRTDTVRQIIREYVDELDLKRARQSFKNEPRVSRR